jgi:hypothetical protein
MSGPRPSVTRFVEELARVRGAYPPVLAQGILLRLHGKLEKLVGPAGFDVLLSRSLVLARRTHPVLAGITAGPDATLAGFDDAGRDVVALREGAMAIVAHFIELLATLIGEDLAMALVRDVMPAAAEEQKT